MPRLLIISVSTSVFLFLNDFRPLIFISLSISKAVFIFRTVIEFYSFRLPFIISLSESKAVFQLLSIKFIFIKQNFLIAFQFLYLKNKFSDFSLIQAIFFGFEFLIFLFLTNNFQSFVL